MDDEPTPTIQVSIEELLARAGGLAPAPPPPMQVIGWWVFRLLLAFIGLSFAALGVFAWLTYPSTAAAPPALWQEARAQWFGQVKEMGQIFILTPLLPLLGAVLGYMFGRQEQKTED
ncbi:MAG: hypothetical protein ACRD0K_09970 [Egibacteraceae bacterium]